MKYLPSDLEPGEAELLVGWNRYLQARYPNPDRICCPGEAVLKKLAETPLESCDRKILDHVARCGPCARELREFHHKATHSRC